MCQVKKACGYDNIDPYVIQQVIPQIATQLAHIFNRSFVTGIAPSKLKIAKVIPIYKNENPELFANYRPISILPSISKILERLMYTRLHNFLADHNIISKKQYGFTDNYSTYMAIIYLVDKISSNIDNKNIVLEYCLTSARPLTQYITKYYYENSNAMVLKALHVTGSKATLKTEFKMYHVSPKIHIL